MDIRHCSHWMMRQLMMHMVFFMWRSIMIFWRMMGLMMWVMWIMRLGSTRRV